MFRKARHVLIGAAGAILFALLAAHAQPVRAQVLRRVVEAARSSLGIEPATPDDSVTICARSKSRLVAERTVTRLRERTVADVVSVTRTGKGLLDHHRDPEHNSVQAY